MDDLYPACVAALWVSMAKPDRGDWRFWTSGTAAHVDILEGERARQKFHLYLAMRIELATPTPTVMKLNWLATAFLADAVVVTLTLAMLKVKRVAGSPDGA